MGSSTQATPEKAGHSRFLLPVLGLSVMSTWLVTVTFQLLLFDIARDFQVQVGTAGLTAAVGSISGIIFGLLMAVVSIRYNHKMLLLLGLIGTFLAALGFFLAPNFAWLLVPNIGVGAGIAIVTSMAYSIVGDVYPLQKRGRAIGVMVAATGLAYVAGAPLVDVIADVFGGWRSVMILLSIPITLISLGLGAAFIPNKTNLNPPREKEPFSIGCKLAFTNRSTMAALTVTMFMLAEAAIGFYAVSFFREQFNMSLGNAAIFTIVGSIMGSIGGVVSGLLVNQVGRKRLGTITCVIAGALTFLFTFMPTVEASFALGIARFWFSSMTFTAGGSLIIEQLPKYRSTMMSLNTAFMNVGMLLASLTGGVVLNLYGYQALGMVLGSMGILGAFVWIMLVKEPLQKQ